MQRSAGLIRRCLGQQIESTVWRAFSSSASPSAPEAGTHSFSLGDTKGVSKEEFADTYPDAYIMKIFQHQQQSYRRYLDGLKDIQIPQDPNTEEFSTYVTEMEKLKAKSGLPTAMDMSGAQVVTMAMESDNSFRKFLGLVTEGADLGENQENWDAIRQALDEVEAAEGPVPLTGNSKAAQAFSQKMKEVTSKVQRQLGPSLMTEVIEAYRTQFQQFRAGQEADSAQLIEADGEDEADFLEEGEDEEVK